MFWHGRSFGVRISAAMKIGIFKNFIFAMPQFMMNCFSIFSGVSAIEDVFKSLYLIYLTMDSYAFFILFEKDVSWAKYGASDAKFHGHGPDEPKLPYSLAKYYAVCRDSLKRFRVELVYWLIYATISGCAIAFIYVGVVMDNFGMLDQDGMLFGLKSFGLYQMIANCIAH
jgi:hypothetical protein